MPDDESKTFQPDPQYAIAALREELQAANDNRYYLVATLKQLQTEFQAAKATWEAERDSLLKREAE